MIDNHVVRGATEHGRNVTVLVIPNITAINKHSHVYVNVIMNIRVATSNIKTGKLGLIAVEILYVVLDATTL